MQPQTPVRRTYVWFQFSESFESECEEKEKFLDDEENEHLQPGILDRITEQYNDLEVQDRRLDTLRVPKGVVRFYFYDRITVILYAAGTAIEAYTDEIDESDWYYMECEGDLVTREELERDTGPAPQTRPEYVARAKLEKAEGYRFHPIVRDSLLDKMDEENCDRLFESGAIQFPLEPTDTIIEPHKVQMVDTEIPWPND